MNTKTFAQQARSLLMEGVAKKLIYWGFNPKGEVLEEPTAVSGGYTFRGDAYDDANVPRLWASLKNAIAKKGIEVVVEEAAYTWFNRMMAIRILAKNGYDLPQLDYAEGLNNTPIILQKARQGQYNFLNATEKTRLQSIIGDYNKETEAFALLLVGYCHSHNTLNKVFGKLDDYTELLLPDNMLQDQGFLHLLNTTDAISDEEYQQVELIGWLYQFYISERKDEVFKAFKKKKKAEAKDIPAATQIFTPNWIVKYMVENTAGKLWLDHKPDSALRNKMKYLVSSSEEQGTRDETNPSSLTTNPSLSPNHSPLITNVEDLSLIDPACGSGHILVEGFELLYQMYLEEYYTPEEAVQTIFEKNLYGLDIDDRAAQLATFAVMLKAAQVYPDVWDKDWQLNIYAMPEANSFSQQEVADFLGEEGKDHREALEKALQLMQQAKNLGSVMQLELSEEAIAFIAQRYQAIKQEEFLDFNLTALLPKLDAYIPVLLTLSQKFTAVVANPPYMGQKSMNADLKNYVNAHYPMTKSDLMTIFMEVIPNLTIANARFALINLPSWLFLSSFEKIRNHYIDHFSFDSLLHMGRGIFGIDFGSVAFAMQKGKSENAVGSYFRLHERNFQHIYYEDIEKLFLYSNNNESYKYDFKQYRGEEGITEIPENGTENGLKLFYPNIPQTNFEKIPGSPIAYWVSEKIINLFVDENNLGADFYSSNGVQTGKNELYVRFWNEINFKEKHKWFPYIKGGPFRKWYGNNTWVVNWENDGNEIRSEKNSCTRGEEYYFKECVSWSDVTSGNLGARYYNEGFLFDASGPACFPLKESSLKMVLGILNSKFSNNVAKLLNPTLHFQSGNFRNVPLIKIENEKFEKNVDECVSLSRKDWDSRETSWDFEQSPLLLSDQGLGMRDENSPLSTRPSSLSEAYERWEKDVTQDFFQLHQNEEELNRIFIDIYGLQDELTPEVALKDITILQEELNRKQLEKDEVGLRDEGIGIRAKNKGLSLVPNHYALPIDKAEVMQQFISYAIGLFMGRYRLDQPGLHIAHPNPSQAELEEYIVISGKGYAPSIQQDILNYISNEHPEFSRSIGLAEINASGNTSLSTKQSVSESGNVWANESNSQGGSIRSEQHSGRTSEGNQGVSSLSEDSQRLTGRNGDTIGDSQSSGISGQQNTESDSETNNRNQQNAEWIKTEAEQLITHHSSLSTHHSPFTTIKIDEDAIIPLMGTAANFKDDALYQIPELLDTLWGKDTRTENLNFLQDSLNKDLEKYLVKDFWKYHCKTYKKKPIYWLFSSIKGAFQVLVYMHRMNAFTVEKIRANYLLEHLKYLNAEITALENNAANLNTQQARKLDQLRKDLVECEEYDMHLKNAADAQINFDLDDGVTENYKLFEDVVAKIK